MKTNLQTLAFYVAASCALAYSVGFGFTLAIIGSEHAVAVFNFMLGI